MQILSHTGNAVYIGHFQGKAVKNYIDEVEILSNKIVTVSQQISVITTFKSKETALTAAQLERNNIPYVNSYRDFGKRWSNVNKIELYVEQLRQTSTQYSLLIDGYDVLILRNLDEEFIDKFKTFNKRAIYNSTKNNYPDFEIDHIKNREQLGEFKYLNAGVVFGETQYLLALYEEMLELVKKPQIINPWESEQMYVRIVTGKNEDVTFDSDCVLFQTFSKTNKVNLGNVLIIT